MLDQFINPTQNLQKMTKCLSCNRGYVPEIIFWTVDPPSGLEIIGKPEFI